VKKHLRIALLAAAVVVAVGLVACDGDDDESSTTPTPDGPTASALPTQAANSEAIDAAEAYLIDEGVDGEKGEFTAPLNCTGVMEDSTGKFCVHDSFTTYAPGLVILRFAEKDNQNDDVWEIRVEPGGQGWQVTSAQRFTLSE